MELHTETTDPLRELITVFVPTLEENIADGKTFLAENPHDIIKSGKYSKVPLLTGVDSDEGLINSAGIFMFEKLQECILHDDVSF
jgi:hypothetical protein